MILSSVTVVLALEKEAAQFAQWLLSSSLKKNNKLIMGYRGEEDRHLLQNSSG